MQSSGFLSERLATLQELIRETGATAVYWNRRYGPEVIQRDREVKTALRQAVCVSASFNGSLLFEPWTIRTKDGHPYKVFSFP